MKIAENVRKVKSRELFFAQTQIKHHLPLFKCTKCCRKINVCEMYAETYISGIFIVNLIHGEVVYAERPLHVFIFHVTVFEFAFSRLMFVETNLSH